MIYCNCVQNIEYILLFFRYTVVHDFEHYWTNEETDDIPITSISPEEYKIKSSSNHEYYVYKLFIKNCFS